MDAYNDGSDVVESQASQLIRDLLEPVSHSNKKSTDARSNAFKPDLSATIDNFSDSLPSPRSSNSLPHYQFHGLAATQTQSQHYTEDGEEPNEGSQKENMGSTRKTKETRQADPSPGSRSISPHVPPARNIPAKQPRAEKVSHSLSKVASKPKGTASKPTPTVTFLSPNRSAPNVKLVHTTERTGRTTYRAAQSVSRPKSRDSSQDSFGRLSPNPQDRFLASSKKFDIPLSELGRLTADSEETPDATGNQRSQNSTMFGYSFHRRTALRRSPSPQGRVLVESTPSNSGSSQSQSHEETQPASLEDSHLFAHRQPDDSRDAMTIDGDGDGDMSQGYESSAPSSSYGRLLAGGPDPDAIVQEPEPTQPSTQPDDSDMLDTAAVELANQIWAAGQSRTTADATATTTTDPSIAPNSLLSMVNPNNLWRYQKYQTAATRGPESAGRQAIANSHRQPATMPSAAWQETQPALDNESTMQPRGFSEPQRGTGAWEETQPSEEGGYSKPPRVFPAGPPTRPTLAWEPTQPSTEGENEVHPRRAFPRRRLSSPPPPAQRSAPRDNTPDQRQQPLQDMMDVIPDSEPLRGDSSSTPYDHSPAKPGRATGGVIETSRISTPNQEPDATIGDVVPDSVNFDDGGELTEEEEEEAKPQVKLVQRKEEEEEDDEDDIPLAAKPLSRTRGEFSRGKGNKGKEKARAPISRSTTTPKASKGRAAASTATTASSKGKAKQTDQAVNTTAKGKKIASSKAAPGGTQSWKTGEVPSSLPEQDAPKARGGRKRQPSGDAPEAGTSKARTTSAGKTTVKSRLRRASSQDDDSDDELLMPPQDEEGDDATEPADPEDEDYMEVDLQAPEPASRKRKRGRPAKSVNARSATKAPSKTGKLRDTTPSTRQTKRLRSGIPSMTSRTGNLEPTRVFALWKQDGHFYSGVVQSSLDDERYKIRFDDADHGEVNIMQMRSCELRIGDDVIPASLNRSSKVVEVDKLDQGYVGLNIDDELVDVKLRDIRIAHKTISNAWKDRMINPDSIIALSGPSKWKLTPSPSKASLVSVQSSRTSRKKLLVKTGLMVTLSVGNGNWSKEKENIMNSIRMSGATVVNDISSVIHMDGKHYHSNNRWMIQKSDVQWIGKSDVERLFLLADDPNQKPKFLTALALGIPCLSINWLLDSLQADEEKEWLGYTLPQGYSEALCARPLQQVDVDWGNSVHQLTDIVSNAVPCKLFSGKSILCVGTDMVPLPKGKTLPGVDEKSQEAINAVARIILAMGADWVEAVTELRYASTEISSYDYIVIRDASHYTPEMADGTTVHWSWVKDCLIASRYLPLPIWQVLENSQET